MQYLLAEAKRLNVTIETGTLPAGESGRYIHAGRRIVLDPRLGPMEAQRALAIALGHAHYGHIMLTPDASSRAKQRARVLLVRAGMAMLASTAAAVAFLFVLAVSASAATDPAITLAHRTLHHVSTL